MGKKFVKCEKISNKYISVKFATEIPETLKIKMVAFKEKGNSHVSEKNINSYFAKLYIDKEISCSIPYPADGEYSSAIITAENGIGQPVKIVLDLETGKGTWATLQSEK